VRPPIICARKYTNIVLVETCPLRTETMVTIGLMCPPEIAPIMSMADKKVAAMMNGLPDLRMAKTSKNVPKNSPVKTPT